MKNRHLLILALAFLLVAAPTLSAGEEQGIFEVRIKDHREAIGDFAKLILNFDGILVSPRPGIKFWQTGWKSLLPGIPSLDLTKYTGKQSVSVFRGPITAGSFDAIHLKIKNIEATLTKTSRSTTVRNKIGPIKLTFATSARADTLVVLDLTVLDMSDHPPAGYELNLKGYELYTNGKLVEKVPPG